MSLGVGTGLATTPPSVLWNLSHLQGLPTQVAGSPVSFWDGSFVVRPGCVCPDATPGLSMRVRALRTSCGAPLHLSGGPSHLQPWCRQKVMNEPALCQRLSLCPVRAGRFCKRISHHVLPGLCP